MRKVTNDLHNYVFYLAVHYSEFDITLRGCVLTEEQPGGSKLNEDGYMSVVDLDVIFFTVLAQVLRKTPWEFAIGTVYNIYPDPSGQGILVGNKRMVDILKMEQVDSER